MQVGRGGVADHAAGSSKMVVKWACGIEQNPAGIKSCRCIVIMTLTATVTVTVIGDMSHPRH